jgi:AcrR family transcriptional regulator
MTEVDKQTAILAATLDLIAEQGFHNTPMSQIAKRSGVSAGIIYHYFENKDDLIHELYRHVKKQFAEAVILGEPYRLAWPQNMERLWLNVFAFYRNHPKETLFLEQYDNSPYAKHEIAMDENFQFLQEMIETAYQAGHIRPMPEMVLYELTVGVALNLAKRQIAGQLELSQSDLEAIAAACVRAVATEK